MHSNLLEIGAVIARVEPTHNEKKMMKPFLGSIFLGGSFETILVEVLWFIVPIVTQHFECCCPYPKKDGLLHVEKPV